VSKFLTASTGVLVLTIAALTSTAMAQDTAPPQTPTAIPSTTLKVPAAPAATKPVVSKSAAKSAPVAKAGEVEVLPWSKPADASVKTKPATGAPSAAAAACPPLYEAACRETPKCVWIAETKLESGPVVKARCADQKASAAKKKTKPTVKAAAKPETNTPKPTTAATPAAEVAVSPPVVAPVSPPPVTVEAPVTPVPAMPDVKKQALDAATSPIVEQMPSSAPTTPATVAATPPTTP
jgi:hypothetical protein